MEEDTSTLRHTQHVPWTKKAPTWSRPAIDFMTHSPISTQVTSPAAGQWSPGCQGSGHRGLGDRVLSGLHWEICLIYLDDIIVFSETFEEHVTRLQLVLRRLKQADLKVTPKKCHLFQFQVEFLGHIISAAGISTDPKKTEATDRWPPPKSIRDVRSFIGLCSYYRRFVKGFADITKPLYMLMEKEAVFSWTAECEQAFQTLKSALVTPPILAYPSRRKSSYWTLMPVVSVLGLSFLKHRMVLRKSWHITVEFWTPPRGSIVSPDVNCWRLSRL